MMNTKKIPEADIIRCPFTSQIMFAKVLEDPEICMGIIQRIFPDRKVKNVIVKEVVTVTTEATLIPGIYAKYIRLDALFDDDESWYDIELQMALEKDLPKRGRYYSSVLDVTHLKSGEPYGDLKPGYVIFICGFDYYGKNEPTYVFERFDRKKQLSFGDESYIILLNTTCPEEKVPASLKSLFRYINSAGVTPGDGLIEQIHDRVVNLQDDWEVASSMTMEEEYLRRITKAEREAAAKGLEEGRAKGRADINKLTALLLHSGRIADLERSVTDPVFQDELLKEFGLAASESDV